MIWGGGGELSLFHFLDDTRLVGLKINNLFKLTLKLFTGTSAFAVLMEGAKILWSPNKPSLPSEIKTRKRNDFLHFMEERKLMWPEREVSNVGEVFVQSFVDVLWYIDGHHNTFNERSCKIPLYLKFFVDTMFHKFTSTANVP